MVLTCALGATLPAAAQSLADALDTTNLVWATGGDAIWFAQTTNTYDGVDAVRSGTVNSNQTTWLETTVVGPATISFWSATQWSGFFSWGFTANGMRPFSGYGYGISSYWSEQTYDLGEGTNVLRWVVSLWLGGPGSGFVCVDQFAVSPPRPLAIIYQPTDTTIYSGEAITLGASAIGTPPLQYQWCKDGTNIVFATNAWFYLPSTATNDTGIYSLIVSNSQGYVVSSNALLTVLPPVAPFFTYEPESVIAYTGQNFQWWAGVDGSPPFTFQWRKDGTNIPAANWSWLTLTNLSPTDAGIYTLCVTNDWGGIESTNAVLTVIPSVAPVITRQPRSLEVAEGVNTWMTVEATGTPGPYYVWTKVGDLPPVSPPGLIPPPQLLNPNSQHLFNDATTNDAGVYFATVSNYGGAVVSQDALLTVLPAITNVGSWGQDAEDVFVTNGLAYLARGTNGLAILDVSNPSSPQLLGSCDTPGYASAVRVSDELAFVADGSAGLQIISVTNPSNPILVGGYETPGYASDVAIRSNLVYLADGNAGLLILSVSNSTSPSLVGSYVTNLSPAHICLSGNLVYLTALQPIQILGGSNYWVGGMLVLDVSCPAQPAQIVRWVGSLGEVAARDQLVFVDTSVISVTNPAQPAVIGSMNYYSSYLPSMLSPINVQVVNDLLYMLASLNNQTQLIVFDVRDPSKPIPIGDYAVGGDGGAIWVDGNFVYIAGYDSPLEILETPFNTNPVAAPALSVSARTGKCLRIQGRRGFHYDVEYTDQLNGTPWQTLQTILLTNENSVIDLPSGPAVRFFRLKQLD